MKFNLVFRILLGLCSLLVIYSLFLPLWEIYLWAPQYPEGLSVQIWHNEVKGDVDVINGLNHYIGMKHIKTEMFPEFLYLKYIILGFVAFGLLVAIQGSLKFLKIFFTTTILGGIIAFADFYRWGYDYGHNLDPTAPIQVPGMAYQPPIIGYKDLLNFTALSMPASGGWIIISVGVISFIAILFHWFKSRKLNKVALLLLPILAITISSCSNSIPNINFGKDDCDFCKMKIMDKKFGIAFSTPKGRTFKFDDAHCYTAYLKEFPTEVAQTYVVCFDDPEKLIDSKTAFFASGQDIKSPMGGGVAFFKDKASSAKFFPNASAFGTYQEYVPQ